jgi:hypothetical protein
MHFVVNEVYRPSPMFEEESIPTFLTHFHSILFLAPSHYDHTVSHCNKQTNKQTNNNNNNNNDNNNNNNNVIILAVSQ